MLNKYSLQIEEHSNIPISWKNKILQKLITHNRRH